MQPCSLPTVRTNQLHSQSIHQATNVSWESSRSLGSMFFPRSLTAGTGYITHVYSVCMLRSLGDLSEDENIIPKHGIESCNKPPPNRFLPSLVAPTCDLPKDSDFRSAGIPIRVHHPPFQPYCTTRALRSCGQQNYCNSNYLGWSMYVSVTIQSSPRHTFKARKSTHHDTFRGSRARAVRTLSYIAGSPWQMACHLQTP